jgi:hypothetical protein
MWIVTLALALIAGIAPAAAQNYPSRTITLIVPFPPGGSVRSRRADRPTSPGASWPSTWAKPSVSR